MTYETPTVTKIGKAEELIRGLVEIGADLDGHLFVCEFEFLNDQNPEIVTGATT